MKGPRFASGRRLSSRLRPGFAREDRQSHAVAAVVGDRRDLKRLPADLPLVVVVVGLVLATCRALLVSNEKAIAVDAKGRRLEIALGFVSMMRTGPLSGPPVLVIRLMPPAPEVGVLSDGHNGAGQKEPRVSHQASSRWGVTLGWDASSRWPCFSGATTLSGLSGVYGGVILGHGESPSVQTIRRNEAPEVAPGDST